MTVPATGVINEQQQILGTSLANCPAFVERIGRPAGADAADRVFYLQWTDDQNLVASVPMPMMVIGINEGSSIYEYVAGGSHVFLFPCNNQLTLEIRDQRRYPDSLQDDAIDFQNFVSAIVEYLAAGSGQDGFLDITGITWGITPHYTAATRMPSNEAWWECRLNITWGIEP